MITRLTRLLLLVLSLTIAATAAAHDDGPADSPPNIGLIPADDPAWSGFGCMGRLCRPSLTSIITGRFLLPHGITGNGPPRSARSSDVPDTSDSDRRPNILFVVTDDQRWDMMGGVTPVLQTPVMDRLARDGQRFREAYVTTSICAASRASILTGLVESTHGYTFGTPPLAADLTPMTYPAVLRASGYQTGFVGKFGVRTVPGAVGAMFDVFTPLRPPYRREGPDGTTRHLTDITADEAIAFIEAADRATPFCLSVSFNAPHAEDSNPAQYIWPATADGLYRGLVIPPAPLSDEAFVESMPPFLQTSLNRVRWTWRFDTPEKYQSMATGYYRMISGVDAALGRILAALEASGHADDTVVIFTSDNGYFLNDRGFAGKWLPYDASLRVPLVVFDPGAPVERRGVLHDAMALNIDLAPTILELAGCAPPDGVQGRSLAPWLRGASVDEWRTDFFCEHRMHHPRIPRHEGVRTTRYRYSRYVDQSPVFEELYDLRRDPLETVNLVDDPEHAEALKKLRARTDELVRQYTRFAPQEP